MFERFQADAKQAVVLAQQEARRLLQHHVGAEHLLLGLLDAGEFGDTRDVGGATGIRGARGTRGTGGTRGAGGGPAARAMRAAGLTAGGLRDRLSTFTGPTVDPLDPDALAVIGIDLAEVRRATEAAFGAGALDSPPRPGKRGHIPFTPEAKKALELSLRQSLRLGHKHIDGGHVLLGILQTRSAVTVLLRDAGTDPEALRAEVTRLLTSDAA